MKLKILLRRARGHILYQVLDQDELTRAVMTAPRTVEPRLLFRGNPSNWSVPLVIRSRSSPSLRDYTLFVRGVHRAADDEVSTWGGPRSPAYINQLRALVIAYNRGDVRSVRMES